MSKKIDKSLLLRNYLTPKYWPLWFILGLIWLSKFLPVFVIDYAGSLLGSLLYRITPSRRRVARINLKQAYPDFSNREINSLNKKSFKNLGVSILETGTAWFTKTSTLKKTCIFEGKEHIDSALAKNKGIILLTGHFTTLEMGGRLIGMCVNKYNSVYKTAHDPLFNAFMYQSRGQYFDDLIDNKDTRSIIRGLKNGHATWFAPDQDFADQDIVFTPFLGGIASTLTATTKLAKITGAIVVPFYAIRLDKGRGYKLVILPALENFPTDNIEEDSARINKTIENMAYANTKQYLWSHKRFKTQPDRRTNIYQSDI